MALEHRQHEDRIHKKPTSMCPTPPVSRSARGDSMAVRPSTGDPSETSGSLVTHVTTEPCIHQSLQDLPITHVTTEPCTHQSLQDLSLPHVTTEPFTHQNLLDCSVHEQLRGLLGRSPRDDGADFFECSGFNREQRGSGHSKNDTLHQPLYSQHMNLH